MNHSRTFFEKIWIFTKLGFPCFHGTVIIVWWRLLWNMAWKAHFDIDCVMFLNLILSVSYIFWNVQLVKHGAPLGLALVCLNVYSTLRQFCADSFRVTVDNVSSLCLNTVSVANNILSSIQVLIHLTEHPYHMGIFIIHTLQIREWALDDTDKRR